MGDCRRWLSVAGLLQAPATDHAIPRRPRKCDPRARAPSVPPRQPMTDFGPAHLFAGEPLHPTGCASWRDNFWPYRAQREYEADALARWRWVRAEGGAPATLQPDWRGRLARPR